MSKRTVFTSAIVLSLFASAALALAVDLQRIAPGDVNMFIGAEVHGAAQADLGVVSQVNPGLGLVAISGKHGEFAVVHVSLLRRDGPQIYAPTLNVGHIEQISREHWAFTDMVAVAKPTMTPSITVIEEQPFVESPRDNLPPQ
jgi:hypothetical protein